MRLVFIYGPPAVGKLSVARELSKITGYRLFHNHASLDFVGSIFDFGTPTFNRLVVKYRKDMLDEAARAGIDTVFTSAWVKGYDQHMVKMVVNMMHAHGGEVCFVYLYCAREELLRRVGKGTRRLHGKMRDTEQLRTFLKSHAVPSKAPIRGSLSIDNTRLTPREAAEMIVKHYGLRRVTR